MLTTLTPAVWQLWCYAVLSMAMVMAIDADLRERRIPNVVVVLVFGAALALHLIGPANGRAGPLDNFPGALSLASALAGTSVGFCIFFPLYLLRVMGAGDVKLLAAMGTLVGPAEMPGLALCVLLAGGLQAVVRMLMGGKTHLVLRNLAWVVGGWTGGAKRFDPALHSADRMPFSIAIAVGLLAYSWWRSIGASPLISPA
jgi:prepilin peptidase CpaA